MRSQAIVPTLTLYSPVGEGGVTLISRYTSVTAGSEGVLVPPEPWPSPPARPMATTRSLATLSAAAGISHDTSRDVKKRCSFVIARCRCSWSTGDTAAAM